MERRIERALIDLQDVLGNLLDALGDGPPVQGILLQRAQDQQVERAGQQIGRSRHGVDRRHYKLLVSTADTKLPRLRRARRRGGSSVRVWRVHRRDRLTRDGSSAAFGESSSRQPSPDGELASRYVRARRAPTQTKLGEAERSLAGRQGFEFGAGCFLSGDGARLLVLSGSVTSGYVARFRPLPSTKILPIPPSS